MGDHDVSSAADEARLRSYMLALLADVKALETMIADGQIESGVRRIGAEQEMFLIDEAGRPINKAVELMQRLSGGNFTHELALFNLEANLSPQDYGGSCLRRMEEELCGMLGQARQVAGEEGCKILLMGILPTLRQANLGLDSMTPNPRYLELNRAMTELRGGCFQFRIKGVDELELVHDNVMLESCNTSFQIHFQVSPEEFVPLYNLAQALTGPVLATAANSPCLLGQRLWHETRVALFQQSVDARSEAVQARGARPRVHFGDDWVRDSVVEIFREDIARFRVVLASDPEDDPMAVLARGEVPELKALRMHCGTVYRWNRACYGIGNGVPHLRIENRVLPAGPTPLDEMAGAALFFGLMSEMAQEYPDISARMQFDHAKENFLAAARHGLRAQFTWLDGRNLSAERLILDELLPTAERGLRRAGIDADDIERYLGCLDKRVRAGRTGAQWALDSLQAMQGEGTPDLRARTLVQSTAMHQESGAALVDWPLAKLADSGGWKQSYLKVGQFMTTDLFTVRPGDVVDLAASLMDWRHIRHVPVEDAEGQLVGLVSHRALLRLVGQGLGPGKTGEIAVAEIMKADPVSVAPDTPTLTAIELMRAQKVGCLPVVENGRLVGIITERDLISVASALFERHLRDTSQNDC